MALIVKSDVKNHLAAWRHKRNRVFRSLGQPDATIACAAEPATIETEPSNFSEDFLVEHSSSVTDLTPTDHATG